MSSPRCVCSPLENRGSMYNETIGYIFGQCVYSTSDYIGFTFGFLNLLIWFYIYLPQLLVNHRTKAKGLNPLMILLWVSGDLTGLLGLFLTGQTGLILFTQFYYFLMDLIMISQYIWFNIINKSDNDELVDKNGKNGINDAGLTKINTSINSSDDYNEIIYEYTDGYNSNEIELQHHQFGQRQQTTHTSSRSQNNTSQIDQTSLDALGTTSNSIQRTYSYSKKNNNNSSGNLGTQMAAQNLIKNSSNVSNTSMSSTATTATAQLLTLQEEDDRKVDQPSGLLQPSISRSSRGGNGLGNKTLLSPHNLIVIFICLISLLSASTVSAESFTNMASNLAKVLHSNVTTAVEGINILSTLASDIILQILEDESPPPCTGKALIGWQRSAGIAFAWICTAIYAPSRLPQVMRNYKRKSTYGLSPQFIIITMIAFVFYTGSVLIPGSRRDSTNGFRAKFFWVETFPYLLSIIIGGSLNCVILFQIWIYKDRTAADSTSVEVHDQKVTGYETPDLNLNNDDGLLFKKSSSTQHIE